MSRKRIIYGLAYNHLIDGERTTVHCNVEAARSFGTPEGRKRFYHDDAIRFTRAEMEAMDLRGLPLCRQHNPNHRIGSILDHWVDEQGLRIMAEITDDAVIDDIDSGRLAGLSVGYGNQVDMETGLVSGKTLREISAVDDPFFQNCEISVLASKNAPEQKKGFGIKIFEVCASGTFGESQSTSSNMSESPPEQQQAQTEPNTTPSEGGAAAQHQQEHNDPMDIEQPQEQKKPSQAPHEQSMLKHAATLAARNKELEAQAEELRQLKAKLAEEDAKRRQEYAKKREPEAEMTKAQYKKLAEESGVEWTADVESFVHNLVTQPEGGQLAELQVFAAKTLASNQETIKRLKTENEQLKTEKQQLTEVFQSESNVERDMRRMEKLMNRRQKVEQTPPASAPVVNKAQTWLKYCGLKERTRPPQVPMTIPTKVEAPTAPQQQQQEVPVAASATPTAAAAGAASQQQEFKTPRARPAAKPMSGVLNAPANPFSFRNLSSHEDFYTALNALGQEANVGDKVPASVASRLYAPAPEY